MTAAITWSSPTSGVSGQPGAGGELLTVTITGRWRPSDKRKEPWHRYWRQREPMRPTF